MEILVECTDGFEKFRVVCCDLQVNGLNISQATDLEKMLHKVETRLTGDENA